MQAGNGCSRAIKSSSQISPLLKTDLPHIVPVLHLFFRETIKIFILVMNILLPHILHSERSTFNGSASTLFHTFPRNAQILIPGIFVSVCSQHKIQLAFCFKVKLGRNRQEVGYLFLVYIGHRYL